MIYLIEVDASLFFSFLFANNRQKGTQFAENGIFCFGITLLCGVSFLTKMMFFLTGYLILVLKTLLGTNKEFHIESYIW
jgi:hypothetical protein